MSGYKYLKGSDGSGNAVLAHITAPRSIGATVLEVDSLDNWPAEFTVVTGELNASGFLIPATMTEMLAHQTAGDIIIEGYAPGYSDTGNTTDQVAVIKPTTNVINSLVENAEEEHNDDGTHKQQALNPVGAVIDFAGRTAPDGWLMCYGQAISRTTYAALFNILNPNLGTFTITIAAPGVITLAAHGLQTGEPIYMTTTGALPTGLTANTIYYAIRVTADTIRLATTYANAIAGTAITTTGSQSGVHTLRNSPYGLGDGTTTFNTPDLRGRGRAGLDIMGGTSADRLTYSTAAGQTVDGDVLGMAGGSQTHTLTTAQQANATGSQSWHGGENSTIIAGWAGIISTGEVYGGGYKAPPGTTGGANSARYGWTINLGFGGGAHNNVPPTMTMNAIIKT